MQIYIVTQYVHNALTICGAHCDVSTRMTYSITNILGTMLYILPSFYYYIFINTDINKLCFECGIFLSLAKHFADNLEFLLDK